MACDICNKVADELETVSKQFQTKEVKLICRKCANKINKKLLFYRTSFVTRMGKKYINRIKKAGG